VPRSGGGVFRPQAAMDMLNLLKLLTLFSKEGKEIGFNPCPL
jgi:hypothetical protein